MSVEMVIAVHPPFAWLVEWSALTARGERWFLITNDESKQRLASEGRLSCFAEVSTPSAFTLEALEALIEPWLTVAPERVRLATMIEPMQLVVAQLRERFGIPGPGVAALLPFTNKLAMKAAMNGVERYLPKYRASARGLRRRSKGLRRLRGAATGAARVRQAYCRKQLDRYR